MVDVGVEGKIYCRVKPEFLLSCMYLELGNKLGNLKSNKIEHCFNLKMDVTYTLTYGHQTKKWFNHYE